MKRQMSLFVAILAISVFIVSCSDNFKNTNEQNQTIQKKSLNQDYPFEIYNQLSVDFDKNFKSYLEKHNSYIFVREGKESLSCDYGFIYFDSELGEKITKVTNLEGDGIHYVIHNPPESDYDKFKEWCDKMREIGYNIMAHKDKDGNFCGSAYTDDEIMRLFGSNY